MDSNQLDPIPAVIPVESGSPARPAAQQAVAPAWHTAILIACIVATSFHEAVKFSLPHPALNRLGTYGLTMALELVMLAWVVIGLRLRKTPLRSLLGGFSFSLRSIARDIGFALAFWIGSLMVLGSCAIAWEGTAALFNHRISALGSHQQMMPDPSQQQALRSMAELAPSTGAEFAAWILLCLLAGFAEEIIFRGYLQRQFIAASRGKVAIGVVLSALCFGAAHGYEGARGMFLITVFGVLFSVFAIFRRSLRPGMIAHSWQDLLAGLALAFLRSHHVI